MRLCRWWTNPAALSRWRAHCSPRGGGGTRTGAEARRPPAAHAIHYEAAINANNLAAVQYRRGGIDDAEKLSLRALAVKEELLGADQPLSLVRRSSISVWWPRGGARNERRARTL